MTILNDVLCQAVASSTSDPRQPRVRITKAVELNPHPIHQREIQTAKLPVAFALGGVVEDPAGFEGSSEASDEEDGELGGVVLASGPHVRDEEQAGVVEDRPVGLGHGFELGGEVGKLAHVVTGDSLVGVGSVVVRGRVMGRADVEERVKQAREVSAEQEGGDPRLVGLERQGDDVAHQPHVLADVFGQAVVGARHRQRGTSLIARPSVGAVLHLAGPLDPLFDLADAGQILVELRAVGPADLAVQVIRVSLHAIKDALGALASLVVEEAVEGQ